jgi:hypothetical protein
VIQIMTTLLAYAVTVLSLIFIIILAFQRATECFQDLVCKWRNASMQLARRELGSDIAGQAYWFSESKETMELMKIMGLELSKNGCFSSDALREKWRDALKKLEALPHAEGKCDLPHVKGKKLEAAE